MKELVYLDYAATTPLDPRVVSEMHRVLSDDFGNPSSIHASGRKAKMIVEKSRKIIANYMNASIGDIFFTSGATESCHTILHSSVESLNIKRIISSEVEHHCTLHTIEQLKKNNPNVEITLLPPSDTGAINLEELESELKIEKGPTLVSLIHGNNELGSLNDLKAIGNLCEKYKALFMVDAAQTFCKYPIKVDELNIDFLTASAHKFFGPKGTGLMFVNSNTMIKPTFFGGSQERNMRAGTENVHGIAGFAEATRIAIQEMEDRYNKLWEIKSYAIDELSKIEDVKFNCSIDKSDSCAHILSVSFPDSPKSDLLIFNLDIAGICASSGSACASGVEKDSHVLEAIKHDSKRKTIRFSFSHETNMKEIDYLVDTIKSIL